MLKNYLLVSFRNQWRNKSYFFINLFGLTLGIVTCLFGFLWIKDELSMNTFHRDIERIVMVKSNWQSSDGTIRTFPDTPGTVYQATKDEIPEVELACRVSTWGNTILTLYEDKSFMETGIFADPKFFQLFTFPFVQGDPETAIANSNTIAISENMARKYFGDESPMGKVFQLSNLQATVVAVFENIPLNSSIQFDFVLPFEDFHNYYGYKSDWSNYDFHTFIKLNKEENFENANEKFGRMISEHIESDKAWLFLQPFKDIYLYSKFREGKVAGGRIEYIRIFSVAILFVLFIACINFVNLATSRAANRSKEVGVRKVNGALKSQLVFQFLSESFIITLISLVTAVITVEVFLPAFNALTSKLISINYNDPVLIIGFAGILIITTLASGLYPSFYLSGFQPALIIKGKSSGSGKGFILRKFLVAFQFFLSIILLISTFVISNQIDFIRNVNLGFDRNNVVYIRARPGITSNFESFKTKALANPEIVNLGISNQILLNVANTTMSVNWPGQTEDERYDFRAIIVGMDFLETQGINIQEGRSFNLDFPVTNDDSLKQYILTKKSVEMMKLENPIGARISLWGGPGTVVGVADDFNSKSIHTEVDPIVFMLDGRNQGMVFIRFQEGKSQETIGILETLFKEYEQTYPFEYAFMDEEFNKQYKLETLTGKLANMFSFMAIAISCLGLFGLTSFLIEKKTREIGIRKVLGASVPGLIISLSKDFVRLFMLAILIGSPIAYFLMIQYLEKFAYHVDFNFLAIGLTALSLFLVSMLTVIYRITKAALTNPAEVLRSE